MIYTTVLEILAAQIHFPGELVLSELLKINTELLCLHLFIAGICFFSSCLFSQTKYSIGLGAGLPVLMYVLDMLANTGEKAQGAKHFTLFTLFDPNGILAAQPGALTGAAVLLVGAAALFAIGILVFCKKDLHI